MAIGNADDARTESRWIRDTNAGRLRIHCDFNHLSDINLFFSINPLLNINLCSASTFVQHQPLFKLNPVNINVCKH